MNVKELINISPRYGESEVVIPINEEGMLGSHPHVKIKSCNKGIDWDNYLFFLWPEEELKKTKKVN